MAELNRITWAGERATEQWSIALPPQAVLDRLVKATDRPFDQAGPTLSHGRVAGWISAPNFRLTVSSIIRGDRSPTLNGTIHSAPKGCVVEFQVVLANKFLLWLIPSLVASAFAVFLLAVVVVSLEEATVADQLVVGLTGLCCAAVPLSLLFGGMAWTVFRIRSKSQRLIQLLSDLLADVRL